MNQKIIVNCDFQISNRCKKQYSIDKYYAVINKSNNGNKYRCLYCGIEDTHLGSKSHFFKFEKNDHYFTDIDSDTKSYMLGVICGDGHISKDHNKLEIVANINDKETINLFNCNLLVDYREKLVPRKNCYYSFVYSKQICVDVCKHLNILPGKKSHLISLPKLVNDTLMWAFIRGFFDTDGCVSSVFAKQKSPSCYCSSTSKIILIQIKDFCLKFGIIGRLTGIKLKFSGYNALKFMSLLYDNNGVALTRKKNMYQLWKCWVPRKGLIK